MNRIKIALINISYNIKNNDPPLGLAYLAAYARKYSSSGDFIVVDSADPLSVIRKEKPDIVGIGPLTGQYPEANLLAGSIKSELGTPILIGGHHISALPGHLSSSHFDIAVIGEGEQTVLELLEAFKARRRFEESDLEKINGIVFKTGEGKCRPTPPRDLIPNLDQIPFPARDLLKMKESYITLRKSKFGEPGVYTHMMTSRGCPYKCVFCEPTLFWRRPRFHSPEYVVAEMEHLKEMYDVDGILIFDDLFLVNFNRVKKIAELLAARGLDKELRFGVFGRTDLVNEEVLRTLVKMNVRSIDFGLESGSEKILGYLKNNTVTVKKHLEALQLCKRYGLRTIGTFVVGSPDETEEDLAQTLELVKNPNLDEAAILPLMPLPGTELWQYAMGKGLVSEDPSFPFDLLRTTTAIRAETFLGTRISREELEKWFVRMNDAAADKNRRLNFSHLRLKHLRYVFSKHFISKLLKNRQEVLLFLKNARFKGRNK
jgi:anaerobic magnesium-protoporphyrin IX monomethyl ester cyclase